MNNDEFASLPDDSEFASLPDDNNLDHHENILQKAAKAITQISPQQTGYEMMGGTAPTDIASTLGSRLGSKMFGGPKTPSMMQVGAQGEGMRVKGVDQMAGDNPYAKTALNIATDPMTYLSLGAGGEMAGEKLATTPFSKTGRLNMLEEIASKVKGAKPQASAEMGEEMAALEEMHPERGPVDFGSVILKAIDDPKKAALLEEFPDLAKADKVSLQESQDLINQLKEGFHTRVWQGKAKPSDIDAVDLANQLTEAQDAVHPEMADVIRPKYGVTAEASKKVPNVLQAIAGKKETLARDSQDEAMRVLIGNKDFGKVKAYRTAQGVKKVASGLGKIGAIKEAFGGLLH